MARARDSWLAAAGIMALATPAWAQDPSPAPAAAQDDGTIGDIVVTAQRRQESLQSTPISVTALTGAILAERQITNVLDIGNQAPNLLIETVTGVSNGARIFLRGVGEDQAQFNADPAIGIYIDGIYFARTNGALFDFFDIERVEVLRGPQGTLYGRNTSGGAINIITAAPSYEFTGKAEIVYGRFDQLEGRAAISGPIVKDKLAASFSILGKRRDGISFNRTLNKRVNERDVTAARASLLFDPTETFSARLILSRIWDDSDSFTPTSFFTGRPAKLGDNLFQTAAGVDPIGRFRQNNITLRADWELGAVTLTSLTGYGDITQRGALDNDGEAPPYNSFEFYTEQSQVSQEFTANLATDRFKGIIGVYFFDENNDYQAATISRTRTSTVVSRTPDDSLQFTRSYAVFGQGTYTVVPDLNVTLGGRYTWDKKSFTNARTSIGQTFFGRKKWNNFSPKVGIDYRFSPEIFAYATFAKGYKAGGFNRSAAAAVARTPYDLEKVESYEVGLKTDLLDRRLRINVDYFYNKYDGLQLSAFDNAFTPPTTRRFNAAKATTQGIELETQLRPLEGLLLYANLGYLKARYDQFFDTVGGVRQDVTFRSLKGAPKWTMNSGFSYRVPVGDAGEVTLAGEAAYRSLVWNNVANDRFIATEERTLINASAAFRTADARWTFTAAGKNLTNKRYPANGLYIAGLTTVLYPADPRTWSVSARVQF